MAVSNEPGFKRCRNRACTFGEIPESRAGTGDGCINAKRPSASRSRYRNCGLSVMWHSTSTPVRRYSAALRAWCIGHVLRLFQKCRRSTTVWQRPTHSNVEADGNGQSCRQLQAYSPELDPASAKTSFLRPCIPRFAAWLRSLDGLLRGDAGAASRPMRVLRLQY